MDNSTTPRPIVALIDLLSKKWILRMLWELNLGPCSFRELQAKCGDISPTIINNRLKELRAANLVSQSDRQGYMLTEQGQHLISLFSPVNEFAMQWFNSLSNNDK